MKEQVRPVLLGNETETFVESQRFYRASVHDVETAAGNGRTRRRNRSAAGWTPAAVIVLCRFRHFDFQSGQRLAAGHTNIGVATHGNP